MYFWRRGLGGGLGGGRGGGQYITRRRGFNIYFRRGSRRKYVLTPGGGQYLL